MKNVFSSLDKLAMQNKKKTKKPTKPKKPIFICVHLMGWIHVKLWEFVLDINMIHKYIFVVDLMSLL